MDKILKAQTWIEWLDANMIVYSVLSDNGHIRVFPADISSSPGKVFDFWATTNRYRVLGTDLYPKGEAKIRKLALAGNEELKSLYV